MNWKFFLALSFLILAACGSQSLYIPDGNPATGKIVFSNYRCYSCHDVKGESYPAPSAITPTYISFGQGDIGSREYLMESIIAPSHRFAIPRPPVGQKYSDQNIRSGTRSRMRDYSNEMTVREMLDLVAYIESLEQAT